MAAGPAFEMDQVKSTGKRQFDLAHAGRQSHRQTDRLHKVLLLYILDIYLRDQLEELDLMASVIILQPFLRLQFLEKKPSIFGLIFGTGGSLKNVGSLKENF